MEEYRKKVEGIEIAVRADWSQASCNIESLDAEGEWQSTKWQVADFGHDGEAALQSEIEEFLNGGN
jgi:hypothetical protein